MKIIDILNKIANGENVPKVIKYEDKIYHYVEEFNDYEFDDGGYCLISDEIANHYGLSAYLNDEVEILETTITYKPDKIEKFSEEEMSIYHDMPAPIDDMAHKIQEIIDRINNL